MGHVVFRAADRSICRRAVATGLAVGHKDTILVGNIAVRFHFFVIGIEIGTLKIGRYRSHEIMVEKVSMKIKVLVLSACRYLKSDSFSRFALSKHDSIVKDSVFLRSKETG